MHRRHALTIAGASLLWPLAGRTQPRDPDAEAALRQAVAGYVASWNTHDVGAWAEWLTDDVEWVDVEGTPPKRGKDTVSTFAAYYVRSHDLDLRVTRLALSPDGQRATVLLTGSWLELPKKDGQYNREWPRELMLSRWRLEGSRWRLAYLNNHARSAAEQVKAEGLG